jgi:tetratricopeptide (TPR) repeat protein
MVNRIFLSLSILFFALANATVFGQKSASLNEYQIKQKLKRTSNAHAAFELKLALGEWYKHNHILRGDSIKHILLREARNLGFDERGKALLFSMEMNRLMGNQQEFENEISAAIQLLPHLKNRDVRIDFLLQLGVFYAMKNQFTSAQTYLDQGMKLAKSSRNNALIAKSHNGKAILLMIANKKDSSLLESNRAIQYSRRTSNKFLLTTSLNTQARTYAYFGQPELSVAKNFIALQRALENQDWYEIAVLNREIGSTQLEIMDVNGAEKCFNNAIEAAKRIVDRRQIGMALNELGMVYFYKKRFQEALRTISTSILYLEKLQDWNGLGGAYNNLGIIYRERKDFVRAAKEFNRALVLFESTGNRDLIAKVYHNIGAVFEKQGKHSNALTYLIRSIEIRKQTGSQFQIYPTYRILSNVYKNMGKTNLAFGYMEMYLNYLDSNTTLQAAKKIAEMSESYRADQRNRLIEQQAHTLEMQRQERILTAQKLENASREKKYQTAFITGLILVLVLVVVIVFYRSNQITIRQKQKDAEMSQTLLRAQMNPHFVFNAMSVIQSYIYENDTVNSSKFLVNFSRLMRLILENSHKDFISLETEIEILNKYMATQKLRFEDRFDFEINVAPDLNLEFTQLPPMITQPFIENAIEHGQLHTIEHGGWIKLYFKRMDDLLHITITDNGIGRTGAASNKKASKHKSMAMQITRERIENLNYKFKTAGSLTIEDYNNATKTGTKVLISLPFREEQHALTT